MAPAPGCTAPCSSSHSLEAAALSAASNSTAPVVLAGVAAIPALEQPRPRARAPYPREWRRGGAAGSTARRSRRARCRDRSGTGACRGRDGRIGAEQRVDAQRAPRSDPVAAADTRRCVARVLRLLVGRRQEALCRRRALRVLRDGPIARPVGRPRPSIAEPVAAAVAGADAETDPSTGWRWCRRGRPRACSAAASGSPPSRRAFPRRTRSRGPAEARRSRPRSRAPSTGARYHVPAKRRSGPR